MSASEGPHRSTSAEAVEFRRDASGFISAVDGDLDSLLGWSPDDVLGRPSTSFIHPQDQASAVMAWMEMIEKPGRPHMWRGRYRRGDGTWAWVETVNTNRLNDPEYNAVLSLMYEVTEGKLSIEEQLRARNELLAQLADALPVGIVQFDADRSIRFTNDRLHTIIDVDHADHLDEVMAHVAADDRPKLEAAFDAVLAGQALDEVEIQGDVYAGMRVVCLVSLRPLTDAAGGVTGAVATVYDITDRARRHRQLERRAMVDALTSCANRGAIMEALGNALHPSALETSGTAVIFIDLDNFKEINDRHGHQQGDDVLVATADRLRGALRPNDHLGRLGGDEFLVVCPNVEDETIAQQIAGRLHDLINQDLNTERGWIQVRASLGLAFTATPLEPAQIIELADKSMYNRKQRRSRSEAPTEQ